MFFQPKGFLPEDFRKFNAPTVLLLECATPELVVRRDGRRPVSRLALRGRSLGRGNSALAASGWTRDYRRGRSGTAPGEFRRDPGTASVQPDIPRRARAERLTLAVELTDDNGKSQNSWDLWVFPSDPFSSNSQRVRADGSESVLAMCPWALEATDNPSPEDTDLLLTTSLGKRQSATLKEGGRVILLDPEPGFRGREDQFPLFILGWRRSLGDLAGAKSSGAPRYAVGRLVRPAILSSHPGLEDGFTGQPFHENSTFGAVHRPSDPLGNRGLSL